MFGTAHYACMDGIVVQRRFESGRDGHRECQSETQLQSLMMEVCYVE